MTITPRREKTRNKLIEASVGVFAHKGVSGASIEELSEAAGMTRGAFYSNFDSKDELILAMIDAAIDNVVSALRSFIENDAAWRTDAAASRSTEASAADQRAQLGDAVSRIFDTKLNSLPWLNSDTWFVCEQAIELYALRVPELHTRYRELIDAQLTTLAELTSQALQDFGYTTTVPTLELVKILAATMRDAKVHAILGGSDELDGTYVGSSRIVMLLQAFITPTSPA